MKGVDLLFTKATKRAAFLRFGLSGPSGSGKTWTSLEIAQHLLAGTGLRIALVDTEHGSASKYADRFDFDVVELEAPFHPDRFVRAIKAAETAGYGALVLDSLSHAWSGEGGLLEIVDAIAKRMRNPNSFAAWKEATPIQNKLVEAMLAARLHLFATMRSKSEWVVDEIERGGKKTTAPKKVGTAPIQRDQFEYEFDVFAEMTLENELVVSKTRCPALAKAVIREPGESVAKVLRAWLEDGAAPIQPEEPRASTEAAPIQETPPVAQPAPAPEQPEPAPVPSSEPEQSAAPAAPAAPAPRAARVDLEAVRAELANLPDDLQPDDARHWFAKVVEHWPEGERDTVVRIASKVDKDRCAIPTYADIARVDAGDVMRALEKIIKQVEKAKR